MPSKLSIWIDRDHGRRGRLEGLGQRFITRTLVSPSSVWSWLHDAVLSTENTLKYHAKFNCCAKL